jgi:Flp pilus assembly protein TadG
MRRKKERGQATVELALVLPVLLLILFGIMEFGRVFSAYLVITNAAREGARQAAIGANNSTIENAVYNASSSLGDLTSLTVSINPHEEASRVTGEEASVTINYNVDLVIPIISEIAPDPFPLEARSVMRVE